MSDSEEQKTETVVKPKYDKVDKLRKEKTNLRRLFTTTCHQFEKGRQDGNKKLSLDHGIVIPSTITSFRETKGILWVANGQAQARHIPKGMCICFAESTNSDSLITLTEMPSYSDFEATENSDPIDYTRMIASNLEADQRKKLQGLLENFQDSFHRGPSRQKPKINVKHKIDTGNHTAISQRPYRVSPAERRIINEEVDKMLERDVIRPSEGPWSSPVVLVRKKDGSWRFCVDYRRLNKVTKKDVYPLPRIDDTLDCLRGAQYFSSMDLYSGYWQIEVDEADREKTAFFTSEGLYEFKVIPFGLCNAPATFERTMDNLLRHLKWKMCLCYLDDIVVFSHTFQEHLRRLHCVLSCISEAGIVLNQKKCLFGAKEIKVLGHLVSGQGVKPDPEKVKAVHNFPTPQSVKDEQCWSNSKKEKSESSHMHRGPFLKQRGTIRQLNANAWQLYGRYLNFVPISSEKRFE
ncbi:hypothetical protein JTE90_002567 [Oedothorax gibbosus]|uniref:Reverse transcriptase domain-containing protein n=1 Tax=Oedothorax gibbosus TaxID=931172 RepID=A0AAV6TTM1_9ARAC|nr:hypothetical protein JTE90_002567 [Oedothorax gibbosus]